MTRPDAIHWVDGSQEEYFSDVLFFYDDPHTIYDNWPKNVWAAIDAHQCTLDFFDTELEDR